jgi:single-strand DNA-binding protein
MANVSLIGNIDKQPEMRKTANGNSMLTFSIAENDFRNGEESTSWYDVTVFSSYAEKLQGKLNQGTPIYLVGDLRVEEFQTKTGVKGQAVRIVAQTIKVLERKPLSTQAPVSDDFDSEPPF